MSKDSARTLIWRHIRDIAACMMVINTGNGLRARPMGAIARPEQNAIWFFTEHTPVIDHDVQPTPQACLTFVDTRSKVFVSVSGTLTRVMDLDTIKDLWNADAAAVFPNGPDDPAVVLLRFDPEYGEYWDSRSSTLATAIRFLASRVTGSHRTAASTGATRLSITPGVL